MLSKNTFGRGLIVCRVAILAAAIFAGAAPAIAQPPDRSAPPALGPAPSFALPAIQQRTLSNGLPVWIVELHKVPVVQVDLVVMAGAGADPSALAGLASMTAAMLDEGAGSRSALEIADAVDHLGASLRTGSSFDASSVALWVPVARLSDALGIMADVALRPAFPEAELDRLRKERLTGMLQARDDPRSILQLAFPRLVFGAAHRYGEAVAGTPHAVKTLTPSDLRGFHAAHFRPSNAALVVVGDVTPNSVLPALESAFGGWKEAGPRTAVAPIPDAPQVKTRQVYLIDKPGAAQSQIAIGGVGVARATPDYFRLEVLNTILGGSFTSRLNQNLREEHGYTYGAGSSFSMRKSAGPFLASSGVQTEVTAAAVTEFFNELNGIQKPVPADELTKAKNYVALAYPGGFETVGDIAVQLEEMLVYGLPPDYFNTYIQQVQQVSAADLQKAAAQHILPERFAVVIVGDRQKIESGLRALKLGPVTVMTVEQALGPAVSVQ